MISKANWIIVGMEIEQYEHSSIPVHYNYVNTYTVVQVLMSLPSTWQGVGLNLGSGR